MPDLAACRRLFPANFIASILPHSLAVSAISAARARVRRDRAFGRSEASCVFRPNEAVNPSRDTIIHQIHLRVLRHIKHLAEQDADTQMR